MNYTDAIERAAAETVFRLTLRERRFVQSALEQIASAPFSPADFEKTDSISRPLLPRFFGPVSITYWLDHAVKEVRIATILRD